MSVAVDLDRLRDETTRFGPLAFLLTVGDDGRPHAVSVAPHWDGDRLAVRAGKTSVANATARPELCLLWAPVEPGGFSLIADAVAEPAGEGAVSLRPTKAVLHRSAGAEGDGPVSSECVPVYKP